MSKLDVDFNVSGSVLRSSLVEVFNAIKPSKRYRFRVEEISETADAEIGAESLRREFSRIDQQARDVAYLEPEFRHDIGGAEA